MKKTLLSVVAITAIVQAGGDITPMTPLVDVVPNIQGSALDKVSIGGYGSINYINHLDDDAEGATSNAARIVLYAGYQFTDKIKFVSELEFESGGISDEDDIGEVVVEQAYIDFGVNEAFNVKVGHMIVPVGMVNLYHEPTAFYAVTRPEVEHDIIPSTWHENGIVTHGKMNGFSYQAGVMIGLFANRPGESEDFRGMRQSGREAKAKDLAFVARLDYNGAGFNIGGSFYTGDAGQGVAGLGDVTTSLGEIHAGYSYEGFSIKGLYAQNKIDNAKKVALFDAHDVAAQGSGYYVTAAYKIAEWTPFVRYEAYNDKEKSYTGTGIRNDEKDDIKVATLGLNYNPTENVVIKADYVFRDNRGTDDNIFELGLGYNF